jgi:hypothetical protein
VTFHVVVSDCCCVVVWILGYVSSCVSWVRLLIWMAFVPVMVWVMVGCACAPSVRVGWFL